VSTPQNTIAIVYDYDQTPFTYFGGWKTAAS
jgi:hypothetical protein